VHMTRTEHRRYGVSVSIPALTVRAVRAIGHDGLAVRTGQLRPTRPRLTRSQSRFRIDRETLVLALRGSAPHSASNDGPPAPRRLGQPSPCTSPISDVPRRHREHCRAGSNRREAGPDPHLAVHASPGPARPRPPPCGSLRNHHESNRDTFRRVDDRPGCPDRRLRVRSQD